MISWHSPSILARGTGFHGVTVIIGETRSRVINSHLTYPLRHIPAGVGFFSRPPHFSPPPASVWGREES